MKRAGRPVDPEIREAIVAYLALYEVLVRSVKCELLGPAGDVYSVVAKEPVALRASPGAKPIDRRLVRRFFVICNGVVPHAHYPADWHERAVKDDGAANVALYHHLGARQFNNQYIDEEMRQQPLPTPAERVANVLRDARGFTYRVSAHLFPRGSAIPRMVWRLFPAPYARQPRPSRDK